MYINKIFPSLIQLRGFPAWPCLGLFLMLASSDPWALCLDTSLGFLSSNRLQSCFLALSCCLSLIAAAALVLLHRYENAIKRAFFYKYYLFKYNF